MGQRAVHAKGGIRMIIVSQNKERVLWFGRAFNALEYNEDISKKGKQETVRHTIIETVCSLSIGTGNPEWGAEPGVKYYVLHIKKIQEA